jgi:protocatechuate 3,4-dioxygenase, beta subunit
MVPQNEFIQRDRRQHPPAWTPDYKTSVLRSPRLPLWSLQNSLSELTGPVFRRDELGSLDHDLILS